MGTRRDGVVELELRCKSQGAGSNPGIKSRISMEAWKDTWIMHCVDVKQWRVLPINSKSNNMACLLIISCF